MPSLASYRRRKAEIERLSHEVDRLDSDLHYLKRYAEDLEKALKYANLRRQQAETMMRVWQQYVMDHYNTQLPAPTLIEKPVEIPSCIKPKDVNQYIFRNDLEAVDETIIPPTSSLSSGSN